jgi:hypothetical protein
VKVIDEKDEYIDKARHMRESFDEGMPMTISLFREGHNFCDIMKRPTDDTDHLFATLSLLVYGTGAEEILLLFDTYTSKEEFNPMTGEPWGHEEMSFMAKEYPEAIEKGWVVDAVQIVSMDRSLRQVSITLPYKVSDEGVEWNEPIVLDSEDGVIGDSYDGVMSGMLRQVMSREDDLISRAHEDMTPLAQKADAAFRGMEPWMVQAVRDISTVRKITQLNIVEAVALYAERGTDREAYLASMKDTLASMNGEREFRVSEI